MLIDLELFNELQSSVILFLKDRGVKNINNLSFEMGNDSVDEVFVFTISVPELPSSLFDNKILDNDKYEIKSFDSEKSIGLGYLIFIRTICKKN